MSQGILKIRPGRDADLPAITAIYAHNVLHGTGTFELEAPDAAEMARRRADVLDKGLPWLVAERDGRVLGYAYANHFRPRRAYRFCLEDSIYLDAEARGQGVGRMLLAELVARCEAAGARQMLAVIGDSDNELRQQQPADALAARIGIEVDRILEAEPVRPARPEMVGVRVTEHATVALGHQPGQPLVEHVGAAPRHLGLVGRLELEGARAVQHVIGVDGRDGGQVGVAAGA